MRVLPSLVYNDSYFVGMKNALSFVLWQGECDQAGAGGCAVLATAAGDDYVLAAVEPIDGWGSVARRRQHRFPEQLAINCRSRDGSLLDRKQRFAGAPVEDVNSVLALDARTGDRVWHFQAVRHDVWDWDFPAAPSLVTVMREGRRIDAVAQITKTGYVLAKRLSP